MNEQKTGKFYSVIGMVVIVLAIAAILSSCIKTDKNIDAITCSKMQIKDMLKSPSTANFPWVNEFSVTKGIDESYTVNSYVDAQNGFGATIRQQFSCTVTYPASNSDECSTSCYFK